MIEFSTFVAEPPNMQLIKNHVILYIVLVICMASGRSQETPDNLDSLKTSLAKLPNDTASVSLIIDKANKYYGIDYYIYLELLNIAEPKAFICKNPRLIGIIFFLKGCANIQLSDFEQATKYLTFSKIIAEKTGNKKLLINSLAEFGSVYLLNGDLKHSLEYCQKALKLADTYGDPQVKGMVLNKIGGIYYKKQEFEKTIELLKQSSFQFRIAKDTLNEVLINNNIALLFYFQEKMDSAEYYLGKSGKILNEYRYRRLDLLSGYYTILGNINLAKKNYNKSLESYRLSLRYAEQMHMPGGVYDAYAHISETYENQGNYKEALKYHKMFFELMDSVTSQENFAKALEIQNKYEAEKKENELLRINTENEIKQVEIQRMGEKKNELINYIILLISVIVMFIFLLVVLIIHISSRRRAYRLLREKNVQIESQSKELSQSAKLIAKFQFQMNPHFVFNALHNIQGLIIAEKNSKATSQIQRLAILMRKTFNNAEKDYITIEEEMLYLNTYFKFESNISSKKINFTTKVTQGLEEALIPPMMIQPFIENSLKHAQLDRFPDAFIQVDITSEDDFLCVTIEDNGKGIVPEKEDNETPAEPLHSMSIIRSRVELIFQGVFFPTEKTAFSVKTVPEIKSGTMVKFYLPLQYLYWSDI